MKLLFKLTALIALSFSLSSCATTTVLQNGCIVDSIVYGEILKSQKKLDNVQIPFQVLTIKLDGVNHAVCVFQWQSRQFIYDPLYGTRKVVRGLGSSPLSVARQVYPDALDAKWL